MPNNKYERSVKRERQLVNEARAKGLFAARTAGSKSPYDVIVVDFDNKIVKLVQVKTKKGCRNLVIKHYNQITNASIESMTFSWE